MDTETLALLEEIDEIRRLAGMPKLDEDSESASLPYPLTLGEIAEELDNIKTLVAATSVLQAGKRIEQLQQALQGHQNSGYAIINTRDD